MNEWMNASIEWKSECEMENSLKDFSAHRVYTDAKPNCSLVFYPCQSLTFLSFPMENISNTIDQVKVEFQMYDASIITQFLEVNSPPPRLIFA